MKSSLQDSVHFLVLDCFPDPSCAGNFIFAGVAFGCWIRRDMAPSREEALELVKAELQGAWKVSKLESYNLLRLREVGSYEAEVARLFRKALDSGLEFECHSCYREVMDSSGNYGKGVSLDLSRFAQEVLESGFHFYSDQGQWMGSESAEDAAFSPVWTREEDLREWSIMFPDCEVKTAPASRLIRSMLPELNAKQEWVGIGVENRLYTAHPMALSDALTRS